MSIKDVAKHALAAATSHISKVDADHDRMEWLEQHSYELQYVYGRVENENCTVREAIDYFRRIRAKPATEPAKDPE